MRFTALVVITALAIGRAMTLPFIGRAGGGGPGDPPEAWLMPLVGDAAIGLAAIVVTIALVRRHTAAVWAVAIAFHSVAAFDAVAALMVDVATPWPEFFMLELFGRSMFVAAAAMHLVALGLLASSEVRQRFGLPDHRRLAGGEPAWSGLKP